MNAAQRQHGRRNRPTVIGLGELLWDEFPDSRRPGGAPANVAYHAAQLGGDGRIASRVGMDPAGDELLEFLRSCGLPVDLVQRDPLHGTGRVSVALSAAGQPEFTIHTDVAWDFLEATPELLAAAAGADAICFGTLAQRSTGSRSAIQQCLARVRPGAEIVFDVNLRQQWYERETIERSLDAATIVKLNDAELRLLAAMFDIPESEPAACADALRQAFGIRELIVTRGAEGCLVCAPGLVVDVPGTPVRVVDAVGAGDAFTAAYVTSRLQGWPVEAAARYANRIGGLVASRAGAMPDIASEARELRSEFASN